MPGEVLALGLLVVLAPLAYLVWIATSPRRFAVGVVLVAVFVFVLFYPNLSGLPLPAGVYNWYQGLLPTWLYPFQFPVNTDPARHRLPGRPVAARALRGRDGRGRVHVPTPRGSGACALAERAAEAASEGDGGRPRGPRRPEAAAERLHARRAGRQPTERPVRGSGGTSALKCGGSAPWAARRRMTNP